MTTAAPNLAVTFAEGAIDKPVEQSPLLAMENGDPTELTSGNLKTNGDLHWAMSDDSELSLCQSVELVTAAGCEEDQEDVPDLSKSVTFAEDVAVYNLSCDSPQPPVVLPVVVNGETDDAVNSHDPNLVDAPSLAASQGGGPSEDLGPAVLHLSQCSTQAETQIPIPTQSVEPIIVPLRSDEDEEREVDKGGGEGEEDGEDADPPKHTFQITRVEEYEPDEDNDKEAEVPLLEMQKVPSASVVSESCNSSSLSNNQDTIGPLENQSFLKHLNYSVSQAAVNEAGQDGDDLDLDNFAGVKADVDGGWAWVILFAACCSLVITGATFYAAGILMPEILRQIEPNISVASWIGAIHSSVSCLSGPFVSSVTSALGARKSAFLAGLALVTGLAACFFATSFFHLILAHGLLAGVGSGFIVNIMFVITGQYFNRYRGFACGMLAAGAGMGMLTTGSVLTYFIETYGLRGAYLMWAGVSSHLLVFACLLRPSCEETLRDIEKKISREQVKMGINHSESNSINSALNSMGSGLNSIYSNGDIHSAFSGRTGSTARRLRRYARQRSGDLSSNPLLKAVLNKDVSNSNFSVATSKSLRSARSAALSNGNLSIANTRLMDNTLRTHDGKSLVVPSTDTSLVLPVSRSSTYTVSPLALADGSGDMQTSPTDKNTTISPSATTSTNHIHSTFSLANEVIPEHEVVSKPKISDTPPSPTFSRSAPSEFRKRTHSSASHHTSYSHISRGLSYRGPMRNGDIDNESLTSTLIGNLHPKDILEPRYRLGSRSIPALFGSVASFPTALAILRDDVSRIEAVGEPVDKTLGDRLDELIDSLRLLCNIPFLLFIVTVMMWALGESPFQLYLPAFAIEQGVSAAEASSLYTTMGMGSMAGRLMSGLVSSDRMIGPLLIEIGSLGLAGVVIFSFPIFSTSLLSQKILSAIFGVYSGALVPLLTLITIELLGISELGSGFGFLCMFQGIALLLGPPLGGFLAKMFGFGPSFFVFGVLLMLGSIVAMVIAVALGREVGGEDDEHGSLDDLERALRRVSNCISSGSDDEASLPGSLCESSRTGRQSIKHQPDGGEDAEGDGGGQTEITNDSVEAQAPPATGWPEEQVELETIKEEA